MGMAVKIAARRMKGKRVVKRVTKKSLTGSRIQVWNGTRKWTRGGLMKKDLMLSRSSGKIVARTASISAKKRGSHIQKWAACTRMARKQLKLTGFVPMKKGSLLYKTAMSLYRK